MSHAPKHRLLPLGALAAGFGLAPLSPLAVAQTTPAAEPATETVMPVVKAKAAAEPTGKASVQATTTRIGKGKQELRDVPQSVTVVTERVLDDRNLDTMKEALKNTAGISFQAAEGGEEDIRLRGFSLQSTGDIFIDGMRDPAFYERDSFNWDRLELLRGSASMLFGRGSTGGAVNQVSKLPRLIDENEIAVTLGNRGTLRATGDINRKLGESSALRVNVMGNIAEGGGVVIGGPADPAALPVLKLDDTQGFDGTSAVAVEVNEVAHDPELDEAVIAFANADFQACEQTLQRMTGPGGERHQHAETWLVLFDLYRATGQQHKFEGLALEYAQQFGWSAPQWFSLPKLVAESASRDKPRELRSAGEIGWICPEVLDAESVSRLRSVALQLPLPWVFDWSALQSIDAEAATALGELFKQWAGEPLEMRWLSGDRFLAVLGDAAPTGVRDADPAFWVLRLEALKLANRPDQFDEAAIDYCVTYEVSPPSWEKVRCHARIGGAGLSTRTPPLSQVSEVATSFLESQTDDDNAQVQVATVELSGQLVGDIGATLGPLDTQLGSAALVTVNCAKLIRVDFVAAGDLLNWVLTKRGENRSVTFADAHRLVALFFGAMGINENASVRVRNL